MFLSRFILWVFLVGYAAAGPINLFNGWFDKIKRVQMAQYTHLPMTLYKDIVKRNRRAALIRQGSILDINSVDAAIAWDWVLLRLKKNDMETSIHLQTCFRVPPLQGEDTLSDFMEEVHLAFTYAAGLKFHWVKGHDTHIKQTGTVNKGKMRRNLYKVECRPGSVFPIDIFVMNVQWNSFFELRWNIGHDLHLWKRLKPMLVNLKPAKVDSIKPSQIGGIPPVVQGVEGPSRQVLVSMPVAAPTIKRWGCIEENGKEFVLDGFFKPTQEINRFVLSSTSFVAAEIHTTTLLDDVLYPVHILEAKPGRAQETVVELNPKVFHKIFIWGKTVRDPFYDFSLVAYNADNEFVSSEVILVVPDPTEVARLEYFPGSSAPKTRPNSVLALLNSPSDGARITYWGNDDGSLDEESPGGLPSIGSYKENVAKHAANKIHSDAFHQDRERSLRPDGGESSGMVPQNAYQEPSAESVADLPDESDGNAQDSRAVNLDMELVEDCSKSRDAWSEQSDEAWPV